MFLDCDFFGNDFVIDDEKNVCCNWFFFLMLSSLLFFWGKVFKYWLCKNLRRKSEYFE